MLRLPPSTSEFNAEFTHVYCHSMLQFCVAGNSVYVKTKELFPQSSSSV